MAIGKDVVLSLGGDAGSLKSELADVDKAMDAIGLGATAQIPRLEKLNSAFQSFTGKIGSGIGAIDSFAKGLGPWNQALELGGKAIRFATSALDAHAKTSQQAAKDVKALKDEFGAYRDTVMEGAGQIALALLKPAQSMEAQWAAMMKVSKPELYKKLYSSGGLLSGDFNASNLSEQELALAKQFGVTFSKNQDPFVALTNAFDGFKTSLKQGVDYWNSDGQKFVSSITEGMRETGAAARKAAEETAYGTDDLVAAITAGTNAASAAYKKQAEQAKQRAQEHARWKAEYAEFMSAARRNEGRNQLDQVRAKPDYSAAGNGISSLSSGGGYYEGEADQLGKALDSFYQKQALAGAEGAYAASSSRRTDSFLEKHFGPIEDFDVYATAFGTLTTATESAMSAWISGSMSLGLAVKKGIGDALGALASQLAIESLKHGAYALGSLAFGDFAGAGRHALAAGAFGLGAVAAAGAARKLGGSVQAELQAQKDASSASAAEQKKADSAAKGDGGQLPGGGTTIINNIVYGETFYSESIRMQQLDADRYFRRALGSSYVEHN